MISRAAQPLDDDSTIEVLSRAPSPHTATVRSAAQIIAANTRIELGPGGLESDGGGNAGQENAGQEATIQSGAGFPQIAGFPIVPTMSAEQMMNESPIGAAETTSREGSIQMSQSCSPGPSTRPATSRDTPQTVSLHQSPIDTLAAQPVQTLSSIDLDGLSVAAVPHADVDIRESSGRLPTDEHQAHSRPPGSAPMSAGTNANTNAEDALLAGILALARDDTEQVFVSPTAQGQPVAAVSPGMIEPLFTQPNSRNPQGVPLHGSAIPSVAFTRQHSSSIKATPPAEAGNHNNSRKRAADGSVLDERRSLARRSADGSDLPTQLPTPQDSPITTTMGTLSERLDSALAAIRTRTPDLLPVIDDRRIDMLYDACRRNDRFYLLIHVIYCLWSAKQWSLLSQLKFVDAHLRGVHALSSVLGLNRYLTIEVFNLFTNFPRPPETLVLDDRPDLIMLMEEVRCSLFHLASGSATLRDASMRRKCPPCSAEFKFSLKLASPVLQKALFLSILRQSENDPGWQSKALELFEKDMIDPAGSAISIAELNAYHGAQLAQIASRWTSIYGQQLKHYQEERLASQRQQINHQVSWTPIVTSNSHGLPHSTRSVVPAQLPNVSGLHESLSSPGLQHQLYSNTTLPFQDASQLPQPSNQPQSQQQIFSPTPHSYFLPPGSTLSSRQPGIHQTNRSNLQYTQPQSSYPVDPLLIQLPQPGPISPGAGSMAAAGAHPAASLQLQSSGTARQKGSSREWHVEAVVGERQRKGQTEFRVRWKGYDQLSDTWEPKIHLRNAQEALAKWSRTTTKSGNPRPVQDSRRRTAASSTARIPPHVVNQHSMPSALIEQQRARPQTSARDWLAQQLQVEQPVRSLQSPPTAQAPQSRNLQQQSTPNTPVFPMAPVWAQTVHVPPHIQQRPNSTTPANVNEAVGVPGPGHPRQQSGLRSQSIPDPPQPQSGPLQGQPFFPSEPNYILSQYAVPNPELVALHQTELGSPEYHKMADYNETESDARYYQYVEDVIHLPELLTKDSALIRWKVPIPLMALSRRTIALPPVGEFSIRQRNISNGDAQFRLKSIVFSSQPGYTMPTLSEFCTQPAKWPQCLSVSVNEQRGVDFRRKPHYGVDLATDITEMLGEEENEIVIGAIFAPSEADLKYLMGLEIVCVADHNTLLNMPTRIPAASVLSAITNTLKSQSSDDDDLIIQSSISIDLVDPWSSVIWVTPVRGQNCTHRECFDLEAFLLSRTSRAKESGVSSPDKWQCPICKSDCRPPMLVVDEFLLNVRETLKAKGQLHAKAIVVREDGAWLPRLDQAAKDDDRGTPDADTLVTGMSNARGVTRQSATSVSAPVSGHTTPRPQFDPRTVIVLDD